MNFQGEGEALCKIVQTDTAAIVQESPFQCLSCGKIFKTRKSRTDHSPRCKVFNEGKTIYTKMDPKGERFLKYDCKPGEKIQIIPTSKEREIFYITGQSGSGKSYLCGQFIKEYHKKYKTRPIYVISALPSDPTLDKLRLPLKRIRLDQTFVETPIDISEFNKSLVLFDDHDSIQGKAKSKVCKILNALCEIGRHFSTTVLICNHAATRGKETKILLNESNNFCIFPRTSGNRNINYLCDNYIGMTSKEIAEIKKLESRWVMIHRGYPQVVVHANGAYVLHVEDN